MAVNGAGEERPVGKESCSLLKSAMKNLSSTVIRFVDRGSNPTAHRGKTKESLPTCGLQVVPSMPREDDGRVVVVL